VAKTLKTVTPEDRMDRWRKLWGTPRLLDVDAADSAFEEFLEYFVPAHMQRQFLKLFGTPKAVFGNRFFREDASYQNWDVKLSAFAGEGTHVDVVAIYGSPDRVEAHGFRGERRRSLREIVIDDWHASCAIVRAGSNTLYVFVEPKMRGCIVRSSNPEDSPAD
jgi:hypothetical protein